jgi:glycosyltransferase involved in cell wall biosynthesis
MRVLYIQQHFATGRGEAGVRGYNLVRALAARGHEVTVVCGINWRDSTLEVGGGRWRIEKQVDDFRLVQLGVSYSNHQTFAARIVSFLAFAGLACMEVLRQRSDLVFASSTPLTVTIPALVARWFRGRPYVLEVRDLWPDLPIAMGLIKSRALQRLLLAWERVAYRQAVRLVALAPGIEQGIANKAGVEPARIAMVPNGSDTIGLQPLGLSSRTLLPAPDKAFVLAYAGTFGRANGLDAILNAAAVLKRRSIREPCFVLIGDGREGRHLRDRIAAESLDNVRITGLVGKAKYNLALAEIDVGLQILLNIPAFYYGTSPNKFFDYLAVGKPVLVNYPGWMSDLVTTAQCGLAVAPDDPEAFADAVEWLLSNRERLPQMGRAARALAEDKFSQTRLLSDLTTFIESAPREGVTGPMVAR